MNKPAEHQPVFVCNLCDQSCYQEKIEVDFGEQGKFKISTCGECLRRGDPEAVIGKVASELEFLPPIVVIERMEDVLTEYRETPRQGA